MSSVLLFDIDKTLFNTQKLMGKYILPTLSTFYGKDLETFTEQSKAYWEGLAKPTLFNPEEFLTFLVDKFGQSSDQLRPLFFNANAFSSSIYEDVIPALETLAERDYALGIYSEGVTHYQLAKLKLSELSVYFDPDLLFITNDKLAPDFIETLPMDSIVIDDRSDVVSVLAQHSRVEPLWLNRDNRDKDPQAKTIHSLSEILEVI